MTSYNVRAGDDHYVIADRFGVAVLRTAGFSSRDEYMAGYVARLLDSAEQNRRRMRQLSRGGGNVHSKLDEAAVRAIRRSTRSATEEAEARGVTVVSIHNIRARRTWKHVR